MKIKSILFLFSIETDNSVSNNKCDLSYIAFILESNIRLPKNGLFDLALFFQIMRRSICLLILKVLLFSRFLLHIQSMFPLHQQRDDKAQQLK